MCSLSVAETCNPQWLVNTTMKSCTIAHSFDARQVKNFEKSKLGPNRANSKYC